MKCTKKGVIYMIFYISFTLFIIIFHYGLSRINLKVGKIKDFPLAVSMLFLGLLMGMRGASVGTDTFMYGRIYNAYNYYNISNVLRETKYLGWSFYVYVFTRIGIDFHGYMLITSLIMSFLMYKVIIYFFPKKNTCFVVTLFLLMYTYFAMFNTFRYHFAIIILAYGMTKLLQNKKIAYLIYTILAISIHSTMVIGLIFIPIYLVSKYSKSKLNMLFWILIFSLGLFSINIIINLFIKIFPIYSDYLDAAHENLSTTNRGRTIILRVVELLIGIFFFCLMSNEKNLNGRFLIFNLIFANIIGTIFYKRTLMVRLDSILLFLDFISIAYFTQKIEFDKDRLVIKCSIGIAFGILLIIMLKSNYGDIIPYSF